MFIDSTLDIGLRNYEHVLTLVNSVLDVQNDGKDFNLEMQKYYVPGAANQNRQLERLEMFRFIHDKKPAAIDSRTDTSLSKEQVVRCKENFKIFMG